MIRLVGKKIKKIGAGLYTCVISHGPGIETVYSIATCMVYVMDLCVDTKCNDQIGKPYK